MLELMQSVRLAERYVSAPPEPALGRPQAATRYRARVRRRSAARRLRRADVGARRLRPGGDPQPARRAAGEGACLLPLHLPRPRRRAVRLRPDRRALPRPADGARDRPRSSSRGRTTPTPRRCSPPCRRSTAPSASASGSRATSRAQPIRPPAASSTRAARGGSAPICDEVEPPLVEVEPDHLMRCHIPIEELRALQVEAPARMRPEARHGTARRSSRR